MNDIIRELQKKPYLRFMEAHSGLSSRLVEQSNFDGIWESSLTDSGSKGLPDIELVSMDWRMQTIREIRNVSTKPIIVDGDTGGQVDHFAYHVKMLEDAKVSAVIIEDKAYPKRNSLDKFSQHTLEDVDSFARKIKIGKSVSREILVIARLEGLIVGQSNDEVLHRAKIFLDAGADGVMIHSRKISDADEVLNFAKDYRKNSNKLIVVAPTTYPLDESQILKNRLDVIIHANHLLRASLSAMRTTIHDMEDGQVSPMAEVEDIFNITGYDSRCS